MTFSDAYRRQVALLVRTLPFVVPQDCFALKGGTAINFFIRDLPPGEPPYDIYVRWKKHHEKTAEGHVEL